MDKSDVIKYLSSIQVGTLIAWILVIGTIIGVIVFGLKKLYKIFEASRTVKDESDALKKMVQNHEAQLKQISEQLTNIQKSLDEQDNVELKRMRHDIVQAGESAISNKSITIRQLRALEELYEVYHDERHGNGYVSTLMKKVRCLPVDGKLNDNDEDIE
jgi:Sec-independent protein translocase protein TatA